LPLKSGVPATFARDHDYKRHGKLSLSVGIDLLTGELHPRSEIATTGQLGGCAMYMKTAVVFGGAGFIGSHLLSTLVKRGEHDHVLAADLRSPVAPVPGVQYVICDVRQPIAIDGVFQDAEIFNLAAIHVTPGHKDFEYFSTNVDGALNICEFATRINCQSITFTSSISIYGPSEEPLDETSKPRPETAYGLSKHQAERIHLNWQRSAPGNRLIIVRPAVVFGPRERGNFTRLARLLKRGLFIYPGRRDTIKACCYVDELIRSILFARDLHLDQFTFNAAYPHPYSLEDICSGLSRVGMFQKPKLTIPLSVMLAVGYAFEVIAAVGLRTSINRGRMHKLVRSTNIVPQRLLQSGYRFETDLYESLMQWRYEAPDGKFV
jgi:GlcNAc-P-P-Und epimerase